MRHATPIRHVPAILAVIVAAAGCGSGDPAPVLRTVSTPVATPDPESPVAARGGVTYVRDCDGEPMMRPRAIVLACADANATVTDITWNNWGTDVATGRGTAVLNSCVPTCADGRFEHVPADLRLDRIEEGEAAVTYRRMRVFYGSSRPRWLPARETYRVTDDGMILLD